MSVATRQAGRLSSSGSAVPITIAHVVFRFDYGGMENGVVNLINGSDPARFRHVVIALTEVTEFSDRVHAGRATFVALGKRPGKDPAAYLRLWRRLRELKPDIFHTRNVGTLDSVAVARAASSTHPIRVLSCSRPSVTYPSISLCGSSSANLSATMSRA